MVGRWATRISIYIFWLSCMTIQPSSSDCWESCFAESQQGQQTKEYEKIFDMVQVFRTAITTDARTGSGTSNGTVFLLDTTMPIGTDQATATAVMKLQRDLTKILAFTLPVTTSFNPAYLVEFDDKSSWTCDSWKCVGRCDMSTVLDMDTTPIKTFTTPEENDLIDESCEMASIATSTSTCLGSTQNIFAIALVNSPFKTAEADYTETSEDFFSHGLDILSPFDYDFSEPLNGPNAGDFNSYCDQRFLKKAIVGTLAASGSSMSSFPSAFIPDYNWYGYTQIDDTSEVVKATDRIAQCMQNSCCGGSRRKRDAVDFDSGTCTRFANGQTIFENNR